MRIEAKYKAALLAATFALGTGCADSDTSTPTATATDYDTSYAATEPAEPATAADPASPSAMGASAPGEQSSANSIMAAQGSNLERYIDYKVIDQQGQQVGTVEAFWEDNSGNPAYMAISTSENQEKVHVVPAQSAEVNQQRQVVRVKYNAEKIKSAPSFEKEAELTQQQEQQVRQHFAMQAQGRAAGSQQGQDKASIQLKEEQLKVGTRQVDAGGVILRKVVRTETVNKPVQVQHEELVVERVPGSGQEVKGDAQFGNREIFIPLSREEVVVEKNAVVKETVNIGKKTEQEQQQVSEQLRSEELQIRERNAQNAQQTGSPGQSQSGSATQQQQPENEQQSTPPQE